jgi:hypothetical protein
VAAIAEYHTDRFTQATIQAIADSHSETLRDRIADRINPEKIIPFDSHARGKTL